MPVVPQPSKVGRQINSLKPSGRRSVARVLDVTTSGEVLIELDREKVTGPMVMAGYSPTPGDWVLVERLPHVTVVLGAYFPTVRSPSGTVSNTAPGTPNMIEVTDDYGVARVMPYMSTYTPTSGDKVVVHWGDTVGLVLGKRGTIAAPPAQSYFPPSRPSASNPATFPAVDAASWRGGSWYSSEVIQGDYGGWGQNYGSWFYGGAIHQTLSGATAVSAAIYLPRVRGGANYGPGETVHLWRHTDNFRPAGDVSRVEGAFDTGPVPLGGGWYAMSTALAQHLIDADGGVGIAGDPYVKIASRSEDPATGSISIQWA